MDKHTSFVENFNNWVRSLFVETFFVAISLICRPLAFLRKKPILQKGRPIVLVHGYLHNSSAWIYLKSYLLSKGYGPIFDLNLGCPFASIEAHAKKLKKFCDEVEKITNSQDLVLIGHSMGGLVSSYFALTMASKEKKIDIITIGSPLHGTYLGWLSFGKNVLQMRYKSPFVLNLNEMILNQNEVGFFHVLSRTDQIVLPYNSAFIEGPKHKKKVFKNLGHISLLFSPRVAQTVSSFLNELMQSRPQLKSESKDL